MSRARQRLLLLGVASILVASLAVSAFAQSSGQHHWRDRQRLGTVGMVMAVNEEDKQWYTWGTGVFMDADTSYSSIFFVTNRHVYMGRDSLLIRYRVYKREDTIITIENRVSMIYKNRHVLCPTTDDSDFVAIVIPRDSSTDIHTIGGDQTLSFQELNYGEDVLFYGYPKYDDFGLSKNRFGFPIVRQGAVAYFALNDTYLGKDRIMIPGMFLIDGVSYGGGSGSPVFIKRPFVNTKLEITYDKRFAGIVRGHYPVTTQVKVPLSQIPLLSVAVDSLDPVLDSLFLSKMTKDFVFAYQENSGLAFVISSDLILAYIRTEYPKYLAE